MINNFRIILFHKQSTSARTRFMQLANGSICAFDFLPAGSRLETGPVPDKGPEIHPAAAISDAGIRLDMPPDRFDLEPDYRAWVYSANGPIKIFLARFTHIDPPFESVAKSGGQFIDLTQARGLPAVELDLLRLAYEHILGG